MLVDLSTLKTYLGITHSNDDQNLTLIGDGITKRFETFCNTVLEQVIGITELHDGNRGRERGRIWLRNVPITALTSVTDTGTTVTEGFTLNSETGILYFEDYCPEPGFQTISVVYDAGFPSNGVPVDLQRTFVNQVQNEWQNRDKQGLRTISDKLGGTVSLKDFALMHDVVENLRKYQRMVF